MPRAMPRFTSPPDAHDAAEMLSADAFRCRRWLMALLDFADIRR